MDFDCDFLIVGSGFGGSVSALRLSEKGYRVIVVERGRRFAKEDFPKTNWDVRNWLWKPQAGLRGLFQMSFLEHLTVLHGVGVGGGSLVYANTLPVPKTGFFQSPSWSGLADWEQELAPHYKTAQKMLGAATYPRTTRGDEVMREIARDLGREQHFHPTEVAVYFGKPGVEVEDPYFGGKGPRRTGCTHCGGCMLGCGVGAKNTLDKNYLWLAEKAGAQVIPELDVVHVAPLGPSTLRQGSGLGRTDGYAVKCVPTFGPKSQSRVIKAKQVVFAGGVMGTIPLLLAMREAQDGLPMLSPRLGEMVRTNSEALFGVVSGEKGTDFTEGVAITSILHTDDHSHIEPVRYPRGSGFFRTLALPYVPGATAFGRVAGAARGIVKNPVRWAKAVAVPDFAMHSQILLYMRALEGTMSLKLGRSLRTGFAKGLVSHLDDPSAAPQAQMPEATDLANRFAEKVKGVPMTMLTEAILGVPTTAHILGGAVMGKTAGDGVIDANHNVHGYEGLYVIDGSAVSANPGVNPSLTITALAERAMSKIAPRSA
jgi:cholesterol oxidase